MTLILLLMSGGVCVEGRTIPQKHKYHWWQKARRVRIPANAPGWNRRKVQNDHYFSTSITGGYSLFVNGSKDITLRGFVGGAYGIGYEFRQNGSGLWINISPEIQVLSSTIGLHYSINDRWIWDSQGRLAMYHYDMLGGTDGQMAISGNLPILFGYYQNRFYIGAGAKVGYFFYGRGYNHLDYNTHATYDRYIDEYKDMPNHYYTTYSAESEQEMKFNQVTVAACFEVGYDVMRIQTKKTRRPRNEHHQWDYTYILKLALYAEYGFLDINGHEESGTVYAYKEENPSVLLVKPYYTTQSPTDLALRPFYAGIKLTFLFTKTCDRCRGKARVF